ncbi:MAG: radical SAM protein [Candidatus Omnitrophica bacterium]|nr:radical SAM protein [Candidatus Omnitrophota bacterium]
MGFIKDAYTIFRIGARTVSNTYLKSSRPSHVSIAVTNRCNSRCIYCETYLCDFSKELTTQQMISIIDEISRDGSCYITLTGGEPFMRQDIFDIIKHCYKRNLIVNIPTNGLKIHNFNAGQINTIVKCVRNIQLSIDSADTKENDFIRGVDGSLDLAIQGVKRLKDGGFDKIGILTVISRYNYKKLKGLLYLTRDLGLKRIRFQPVGINSNYPSIAPLKDKREVLIRGKQIDELRDTLSEYIRLENRLGLTTNLKFLKTWIGPYFKFIESEKFFMKEVNRCFRCIYPATALFIDSNGRLQPCQFLNNVGSGLKEVVYNWRHNKKLNEIRKSLKKGNFFQECRRCMCTFEFSSTYQPFSKSQPPLLISKVRQKIKDS